MRNLLWIWVLVYVVACTPQSTDRPLRIVAASDLMYALNEIATIYQAQTGNTAQITYGSTGQLAQQIAAGAPVDVFFAADQQIIQKLVNDGHVIDESRAVYAQGRITLWAKPGAPLPSRIEDLVDAQYTRIAVANPAHAPYGMAAVEALRHAGVYDKVRNRLVYGENIAQTLTIADTGNADVAIMALSLSIPSKGQWQLVPSEFHREHPLIQVVAIPIQSTQPTAARAFLDVVFSVAGQQIMQTYGFTIPNGVTP